VLVVFALSAVCLGALAPGATAARGKRPPAAPTVSLTAKPTSVTTGAASTLKWSSTGATACTGSGSWSGSKPVSGSASTGALVASATYTLTCTGAGGQASASATVTVAPAVAQVCQSVAVPAYFYPSAGGLWNTADRSAPGVGIMIANVANGPGTGVNSDYASAIAAARAAGLRVFGYVHTSYGAIGTSTIEANISAWRTLYGVTSIFLDEASTSGSELSYYQTLSSYVHAQAAGAQTIINFGTVPAQSEMTAGDIIVTFEDAYSNYGSTRFPSWTASYPPSRFYNIVYNVPDQLSMLSVLREAASAGVGQIYATNDVLPNPYDTLPSYLSTESTQAHSGC
jgi:spherulation-specific family 4 protein